MRIDIDRFLSSETHTHTTQIDVMSASYADVTLRIRLLMESCEARNPTLHSIRRLKASKVHTYIYQNRIVLLTFVVLCFYNRLTRFV